MTLAYHENMTSRFHDVYSVSIRHPLTQGPQSEGGGPAGNHPAYGTAFDHLELLEEFLDPGLRKQRWCAQLTGSLAQLWADATVLPYDMNQLATDMRAAAYRLGDTRQTQLRALRLSLGEYISLTP